MVGFRRHLIWGVDGGRRLGRQAKRGRAFALARAIGLRADLLAIEGRTTRSRPRRLPGPSLMLLDEYNIVRTSRRVFDERGNDREADDQRRLVRDAAEQEDRPVAVPRRTPGERGEKAQSWPCQSHRKLVVSTRQLDLRSAPSTWQGLFGRMLLPHSKGPRDERGDR